MFAYKKHKVYLVTSLKSSDIDDATNSLVKDILKTIYFCRNGKLTDTLVRHSGEPENCFEEAIMNSLVKRGYIVDAQVDVKIIVLT